MGVECGAVGWTAQTNPTELWRHSTDPFVNSPLLRKTITTKQSERLKRLSPQTRSFSFFSKKISLHLSSAASYPRKYFPETFFVEILVSTFFFKLLTWQLLFDAESLKHFSNSKPPLDYPKTKTQQLKEELVIVVATLQAKICQVSGFEYRNNLAEARPNKPRSWCYKQIV